MKKITWPAWFSSPKGDATAIFETAEDVPAGWTSGAEKQTAGGSKPAAKSTPTPSPAPSAAAAKDPAPTPPATEPAAGGKAGLDAHGHPWSADLHASSKSKTKDGLWHMKAGVARPEPAPGYPLDL